MSSPAWPNTLVQILGAAVALLQGDHDRSRLPAVQLLHQTAQLRDGLPRLEVAKALPALVVLLVDPGCAWANLQCAPA